MYKQACAVPEAEDVITDAARHATVFARDLWRRHRHDPHAKSLPTLHDVTERLSLLVHGAFGRSMPIRVAQPPAPATLLRRTFQRHLFPAPTAPLPATDGRALWLPMDAGGDTRDECLERLRSMALHQAARASRGSAAEFARIADPMTRAVYVLLEARACEKHIAALLPGMALSLARFRQHALGARPALEKFPAYRRPLEQLARAVMTDGHVVGSLESVEASHRTASAIADELRAHEPNLSRAASCVLYLDHWTGELKEPERGSEDVRVRANGSEMQQSPLRSARLQRRPDVRDAASDEDDDAQGAWMVQTAQPHEHAEDPLGMQRPVDRDTEIAADEFADSLSELSAARLVSTPEIPKEVLIADDAPETRARAQNSEPQREVKSIAYPEWDYRSRTYREPGAIVRLVRAEEASEQWVSQTLERHRGMLREIARRFELLRGERVRLRRQLDGDAIDIDACVDAHGDFAAGRPLSQAVYERIVPQRRELAISLLVDVSGSTDSWISNQKRIIDVEREALLLVVIALESLRAPYNVLAFSGNGPAHVTIRTLKSMAEPHSALISRRIAALEPERYTRAGAALRHATSTLMEQSARHRLLLLLSDGKPNDSDDYEGRYGVEDMRQAVTEAKLQGIFPFCLTVDRQAAHYLPHIFGAGQYSLLMYPERLPPVLLQWMKHLLTV